MTKATSSTLRTPSRTSPLRRIRQHFRGRAFRVIVLGTWLTAMVAYQVVGHGPNRHSPFSKKARASSSLQAQVITAATPTSYAAQIGKQAPAESDTTGSLPVGHLLPHPPIPTASTQAATTNH